MTELAPPQTPLVLVVEDDDLLRLASSLNLADHGFRTVEARNADEAIVIMERITRIDALFTDVSMPGSMNGLALAHHVRKTIPGTYVLVTSGTALPDPRRLPAFSDFVPKPYALPTVAALIRSQLRRLPDGADAP